jgi:hypothetical protein
LCLAFFLVVIFAAAGVTAFTRLPSAALTPLKHIVSTEAAHSFTVSSAVEKPLSTSSVRLPTATVLHALASPPSKRLIQWASYRIQYFSVFSPKNRMSSPKIH